MVRPHNKPERGDGSTRHNKPERGDDGSTRQVRVQSVESRIEQREMRRGVGESGEVLLSEKHAPI